MTTTDNLLTALRVLDDIPDSELIELARTIEADAKEALRRRDAVRGSLLRRMHERNATVLVDDDGVIAVELEQKRSYDWDSSLLEQAIGEVEREKYLKWIEPQPGRWAPKSVVSLNNLITKLGNDPKGRLLEQARSVSITEGVKVLSSD